MMNSPVTYWSLPTAKPFTISGFSTTSPLKESTICRFRRLPVARLSGDRYRDTPYYLAPEDKVGQEAFAVIPVMR